MQISFWRFHLSEFKIKINYSLGINKVKSVSVNEEKGFRCIFRISMHYTHIDLNKYWSCVRTTTDLPGSKLKHRKYVAEAAGMLDNYNSEYKGEGKYREPSTPLHSKDSIILFARL